LTVSRTIPGDRQNGHTLDPISASAFDRASVAVSGSVEIYQEDARVIGDVTTTRISTKDGFVFERRIELACGDDAKTGYVGVVKDSRFDSIISPIVPFFYLPFAQRCRFNSSETLHVRTYPAPEVVLPEFQRPIATASLDLVGFDVETMRQGLYTLGGLRLSVFMASYRSPPAEEPMRSV
jgi:hypothetical protein